MKIARYPKEERQKRVFKRSKPYSPIPPTKKKKINKNRKKKQIKKINKRTQPGPTVVKFIDHKFD